MFGNIFLETFTLVEFVMHGSDNFVFYHHDVYLSTDQGKGNLL